MRGAAVLRTALTVALTVVALLLGTLLYALFIPAQPVVEPGQEAYSDLVHDANSGALQSVVIQGSSLTGVTSDGRRFRTYLADDPTLVPHLIEKGVHVVVRPVEDAPSIARYLLNWFPFLAFVGTLVWMVLRLTRGMAIVAAAVKALPDALARRTRP